MKAKPSLTVIILTFNEEIHLNRCISNALQIAERVCVVDSFSTDRSLDIAQSYNVDIYQNKFLNQANQFQWAIDNCNITTDWVMKLDSDEYLTPSLINEILLKIPIMNPRVSGIFLKLRQYYLDKWIRFGGRYPLKLLRIWRNKKGVMEQRLMDEHIKILEGDSITFENDFIHDNLNSLTWMTSKHNHYATREAIEQLNQEFQFYDSVNFIEFRKILINSTHRTRFIKDTLYSSHLLLFRSIFYFLFRYFILLGFLDGKAGLIYHFIQGFWYRFLADAKIIEIKHLARKKNIPITTAIEEYTGIKIHEIC